jgi:hypothetical protein
MVKGLLHLLAPFVLAGAVLAAREPAAAESVPMEHMGHMRMGHGAGLGASAAFDSKGVLWAVYKDGEHVEVRHSANHGRTWSAPAIVNRKPEPIEADGDARPRIAIGTSGAILVTWTRPLSRPYTGEIRYSRSVDGGRTFTDPIVVESNREEITHRFDSLAVAPGGRIFVAWVDKRDMPRGASAKDYRGASIYFAVSSDGGRTFAHDHRVAEHTCECCRIALVPQADGSVMAMWRHVFAPDVRDHAMARLEPDGRVLDFARVTFDGWHVDACPHHGPSLARDDRGRFHAVWYTGAPGREGVHYGILAHGRVEGERRIGGDTAEHADLAIAGEHIAIVWKEFDGNASLLRGLRSNDGGATWRERDLARTGGASDQPRILAHEGRFFVLWNTRERPLEVIALP